MNDQNWRLVFAWDVTIRTLAIRCTLYVWLQAGETETASMNQHFVIYCRVVTWSSLQYACRRPQHCNQACSYTRACTKNFVFWQLHSCLLSLCEYAYHKTVYRSFLKQSFNKQSLVSFCEVYNIVTWSGWNNSWRLGGPASITHLDYISVTTYALANHNRYAARLGTHLHQLTSRLPLKAKERS